MSDIKTSSGHFDSVPTSSGSIDFEKDKQDALKED